MNEKQPPEGHKPVSQISAVERGIALALAVAVLATFIVLVLNPRSMDGGTLSIVRFLAASFAGIAGYLFTGNLGLEAKIPWNKTQVRATGAFAAFVLVLFLFFNGVPGLGDSSRNNSNLITQQNRDNTASNISVNIEGPSSAPLGKTTYYTIISENAVRGVWSAGGFQNEPINVNPLGASHQIFIEPTDAKRVGENFTIVFQAYDANGKSVTAMKRFLVVSK